MIKQVPSNLIRCHDNCHAIPEWIVVEISHAGIEISIARRPLIGGGGLFCRQHIPPCLLVEPDIENEGSLWFCDEQHEHWGCLIAYPDLWRCADHKAPLVEVKGVNG